MTTNKTVIAADRKLQELTMVRLFDAPRELVWTAWTVPAHIKHWWGPHGSTVVTCHVDLRVGGAWHYTLRGADGTERTFNGVYREITTPEKIVYDEMLEGGLTTTILTFEALPDAKTKLTSRTQFATPKHLEAAMAAGMRGGMIETLERLHSYLTVTVTSIGDNKEGI